MKKILGLDLGIGSIGWSLINISSDNAASDSIIAMGSRVIPLTPDETADFTKGKGETVCHKRTVKRSMRRGLDRYQQRRGSLKKLLKRYGLSYDENLERLNPDQIWSLRANAAIKGHKLTLPEIGRVISHINQRRGYKSVKGEDGQKDMSAYLSALSERAKDAARNNQTPGQYFYTLLKESASNTESLICDYNYRIKEQVFPRKSYEDELRLILQNQAQFYPDILTENVIEKLFSTVFYQRPLKSCTHLVSICEFEAFEIKDKEGKTRKVGPKVAPITSPLAQVCRMWEVINNIELKNYKNRKKKSSSVNQLLFGNDNRLDSYIYPISREEKIKIFNFLNTHERMKTADVLKILGLKKDDGFSGSKMLVNGIKGNTTRLEISKALGNSPSTDKMLRFDLSLENTDIVDEITGETFLKIGSDYLREPLYQMWHTLYSIDDYDELTRTLNDKFDITDPEIIQRLFQIDFRGKGHTNKSAKFMCKLIPLLMDGYKYSEACELLGINHSMSLTKEQNEQRQLLSKIPLIKKGELRQPVVEKILNQMIHQVNEIIGVYGPIDEIHVELARSLKQNKEERAETNYRINQIEKENNRIADKIIEIGLRPSRNKISKYRMWEESKNNCMYCGKKIGLKEFLLGIDAEKEHIIPRSLYFNDSFSNKICSCRECNAAKGQMTGYDFMKAQSPERFNAYLDRVKSLFEDYKLSKGKAGISKTKHDLLLTSRDEIPQDFIERDLRQTQYISRKAIEILRQVCRNVLPTTGAVTGFFRHIWGYDEVLHDLNFPIYKEARQTETMVYEHRGEIKQEERIIDWTKRLDHRHHAIDALTIALVNRAHIQRLNTLNAKSDDEVVGLERINLEKWALKQAHFPFSDVKEKTSKIIISFKAGKKVTTPAKRVVFKRGKPNIMQTGLQVPRGPLTEESVYGKICVHSDTVGLKELFLNARNIVNKDLKTVIEKRLQEFDYNINEALKSTKKRPIILPGSDQPVINGIYWKEEFVIKYPLSKISTSNKGKIVDKHLGKIIDERFKEVGNNNLRFVQSLAERPLYSDTNKRHKIKTVRCSTGIDSKSMSVVQRDGSGKPIGFSKNGSNHHIAIYKDREGNLVEKVVPFWQAVMRKNLGLPVIVTDTDLVWDRINEIPNLNDENFLRAFPSPGETLWMSMELNEMFILGLSDEVIQDCLKSGNYGPLGLHIYRVQKLSSMHYDFKRHNCTLSDTTNEQLDNGNYIRIQSFKALINLNPRKIKVDRLGRIHLI